jgi:hypothetical protein
MGQQIAKVEARKQESKMEIGGWRERNKFYASQGSKDQESKAVVVQELRS